jgi:hypothetical protein
VQLDLPDKSEAHGVGVMVGCCVVRNEETDRADQAILKWNKRIVRAKPNRSELELVPFILGL